MFVLLPRGNVRRIVALFYPLVFSCRSRRHTNPRVCVCVCLPCRFFWNDGTHASLGGGQIPVLAAAEHRREDRRPRLTKPQPRDTRSSPPLVCGGCARAVSVRFVMCVCKDGCATTRFRRKKPSPLPHETQNYAAYTTGGGFFFRTSSAGGREREQKRGSWSVMSC